MKDERPGKWTPKKVLKTATITLVFLVAGPEVWVAVEFVSLIEVIGVVTFWSSMWVGFKMMPPYRILNHLIQLLMRWDPYFFIPDRQTVRQMPSMLVHTIPFAASILIFILCAP